MKINLFRFGKIDEELEDEIIYNITMVYEKSGLYPDYLEIYLYESTRDMEARLYRDATEVGAYYSGDIYFAMHDAYYGWPRIHICLELLKRLSKDIWIGGLLHEATHAILHGSIEYYLVSIPSDLNAYCLANKLSRDYCLSILHYISLIVKDYHVTKFLLKYNFTDDEYPFIEYTLDVKDILVEYGNIFERVGKNIILLSVLKSVATAIPYLNISKYSTEVGNTITEILNYFLDDYKIDFRGFINIFSKFNMDFAHDLNLFTSYILEII
ncbi:hypothetical protein DRN84_01345 [Candidatus Geothermarchaeota archaeon]|nr:MAG: hypothetical protein DRN84_01345 [Candidatus Geothermarchaeota archaeon]